MKSQPLLLVCLVLSSAIFASALAKDKAAKIKFSAKRGFQSAPFELNITTDVHGAKLHFTIDASLPTPKGGQPFTGPIPIKGTTTKACRGAIPPVVRHFGQSHCRRIRTLGG